MPVTGTSADNASSQSSIEQKLTSIKSSQSQTHKTSVEESKSENSTHQNISNIRESQKAVDNNSSQTVSTIVIIFTLPIFNYSISSIHLE